MTGPKLSGSRCQCVACGEYFSRDRIFDRHRVGEYAKPGEWAHGRRCLTIAEMTTRGWRPNASGFWVMDALDDAGRARTRATEGRPATTVAPCPTRVTVPPVPACCGAIR